MNLKFWKWRPFKRSKQVRQQKASRTGGVVATGIPGGTSWPDRNYENFAKETYMKNLIAFRCIDSIAKAVALVEWVLKDDSTEEEIRDHAFSRMLVRANPENSWMMFLYEAMSYLCMAGNSFVERVAPIMGPNAGIARELWALRPDRMKIKVDQETGSREAYVYCYGSKETVYPVNPVTLKSDVMHMRMFHPLDDYWGMSITEPASRKVDSSNSMDEWNKSLMDNMGRPGLLLFFNEELTDEQYKRLHKDIRENVEGAINAGRTHILEGAKDAKPYGFSPSEMDWIKSNIELARGICIAWGVPPQLMGIPDANTYSNYQEARTAFYEDTVVFYLRFVMAEFNAWLFDGQPVSLHYCLDNVPAMQYKQDKKWERIKDANFLEENEKRVELGFEEKDGMDVAIYPASVLPFPDIVGGTETVDDEEQQIQDEEDVTRGVLLRMGYSEHDIDALLMKDQEEPDEGKPYANEHACRLNDPGKYDRFRRQNNWRKHDGKRIDAIWGIKAGKTELQAMRMPKKVWDVDDARSYCSSQGGSFEAAGGGDD